MKFTHYLWLLPALFSIALQAETPENARFDQALSAYWQRHPQAQALAEHQLAADAELDSARRWLGDRPSLTLGRIENGDGSETETEFELELPLPIARGARIDQSQARGKALAAEAQYLKLQMAAELLRADAELRAQFQRQTLAAQRTQSARRLAENAARRANAGELAQADLWTIEAEQLAAEQALLQAEQALADAQQRWQQLTGQRLTALPPPLAVIPTASDAERTPAEHPALQQLAAEHQRNSAALRAEKDGWLQGSALALQYRREELSPFGEKENFAGIAFSMPLPFGAPRRAAIAEARAEQRQSELQFQQRERELTLAIERAQQRLNALQREQTLLQKRQQLTAQALALAEKAFELGEQSLAEFLLTQTRAYDTEADAISFTQQQQQAYADLIEAQGFLP